MTETTVVHGAESVHIGTANIDAWIALDGSQIAPVVFHGPNGDASPYALAPWLPQDHDNDPVLLNTMRGDFFCLPFGPQTDGPLHGDPANAAWTVTGLQSTSVSMSLDTADTSAHIEKVVSVRDGDSALYQEFIISGLEGSFNYGTHPIIDFSAMPKGTARISTSPMRWCSVFPGVFSDPAQGETQVLAQGAEFTDLRAVPKADGGVLDLSSYPTDPGHEDLVMLVNDPEAGPIGWSAAVFDGYVWFALKSVADFPSTLLWVSNGGRTQAPWSSRHFGRMGIEDVHSHFADGLDSARADKLAERGISTTRAFRADETTTLRVVHAVAFTPKGFGRVADIDLSTPGTATLRDDAGTTVSVQVDWQFVIV